MSLQNSKVISFYLFLRFFIFRLKPTKIQEMKIDAFHNIEDFLTNKCQFKDKAYPPVLEKMMNYVSKMKFEEEPDYHHFRSLFRYVKAPKSSQKSQISSKL